jgi:hypothetical protein
VTQRELPPEPETERLRSRQRALQARPSVVEAPLCAILGIGAVLFATTPAVSHGIYSGVTGKDGQLCCGADDCSATVYRESGGTFEFLTREHTWVEIPSDRITFLPIPGDEIPPGETHRAHLCYRPATSLDRVTPYKRANVFGDIYLWCAFIPPGGV